MFNRDDEKIVNENIILKGRPSFFLSCKKVFILLIILGAVSYISPIVINYITEMQVQIIRFVDLPLTQAATIITFLIIFLIILWIIWTLISWTGKEYTISDKRVTYKSGILFQKTVHMPYSKIQDVIISQGVLGRIASVGTVTVYSGYDESKLELNNVSKPKFVEETIFSEINKLHSYPDHSIGQNDFIRGPNFNDNSFQRDNNYQNNHIYDNNVNSGYNNYNSNYNPNLPNNLSISILSCHAYDNILAILTKSFCFFFGFLTRYFNTPCQNAS